MTENFNCVFLETIQVEFIWFLHGTLQLSVHIYIHFHSNTILKFYFKTSIKIK